MPQVLTSLVALFQNYGQGQQYPVLAASRAARHSLTWTHLCRLILVCDDRGQSQAVHGRVQVQHVPIMSGLLCLTRIIIVAGASVERAKTGPLFSLGTGDRGALAIDVARRKPRSAHPRCSRICSAHYQALGPPRLPASMSQRRRRLSRTPSWVQSPRLELRAL